MSRPNTAAVRLLAGEREPVRAASTANITLSGLQTIDGILLVAGDRVLVKNQTDVSQNGIYEASSGIWYRAGDARNPRAINKGVKVSVQSGSTQAGNVYAFQTLNPNLGDDDIVVELYLSDDAISDIRDYMLSLGAQASDIIATAWATTRAADYASQTAVTLVTVPAGLSYLRTAGTTVAGDGGAALFKRVVSEPAHSGKVQDASGAWFEIVPATVEYPSRTSISSLPTPPGATFIRTNGYASPGDGGGALYKKVVSEPSHAGKVQDGAGNWFELASSPILPEMLGAVGDGATDDTTSFNAAMAAAEALNITLSPRSNKTYLLSTWATNGYYPTSPLRIIGDGTSTFKGPVGGAYFLRPGVAFNIVGNIFDRWTGVIRRDVGEGGSIIEARFEKNKCVNITGIPFNIEIVFRDSHVSRNTFMDCTGGYVIRIGENTYANQDNWSGNFIQDNILRNITATGSTSLLALLISGRDTLVDGNDIDGLTSTDGESVGIYVKLRFSQVTNNRVRNVTSTGGSGAALDVAGISLKGAIRTVTNSGVQGFKVICADNQIRSIGAQGVKGSGIRCQISDSIVSDNIVQDVGHTGISADDSNGSSRNKIDNNSIESFNMLGLYGVIVSTFGNGIRVTNNSIKDYLHGVSIQCGTNSLSSTLVSGNSIITTRVNAFGFSFGGGGTIVGVMITENDVDLPASGFIVLNNTTVGRVNLRNNDFAIATANGAGNLQGSATGITFTANP